MKFLADHDVYQLTLRWLETNGHDVIPVKEIGMEQAKDPAVIQEAEHRDRLLITRDRDFGALLFLSDEFRGGLILLKGKPAVLSEIHSQLAVVLDEHSRDELNSAICVVEPFRYRLRRIE